jgi:dihydroorotase
MKIYIKGGRVIDPSQSIDMTADLLIADGTIEGIYEPGTGGLDADTEVIDASGMWVVPGLIDTHVHFREPGFEYKEDIKSGCEAAAAGGFTTVCVMPNTEPVTDTPETVEYVLAKANEACGVRVLPAAAITKGQQGEALTDFSALKAAGAVGVTEDGRSVKNIKLMREAMRQAKALGLPVMDHAEQPQMIDGGYINRGKFSEMSGLAGIPAEAEEMMSARDILLAKETGCHLHLQHVSTKPCFDMIRNAKAWGVHVTAETCPHYFSMSDGDVVMPAGSDAAMAALEGSESYHFSYTPTGMVADTHRKMNPPLRTRRDMYATVTALMDGTIDVICTDHAPHSRYEKAKDFAEAPFGIIGLETSFAISYTELVEKDFITPSRLIALMSTNPAKVLGIEGGTLAEGARADVAIMDVATAYTVPHHGFKSKAENTPFAGRPVKGQTVVTIAAGEVIYRRKVDDR